MSEKSATELDPWKEMDATLSIAVAQFAKLRQKPGWTAEVAAAARMAEAQFWFSRRGTETLP